ncbi:Thymidine kinase [Phycisphaerae bacterium RAS1]|nr:Thymidine kinase [Phycisphaerae bacterium RAS1]
MSGGAATPLSTGQNGRIEVIQGCMFSGKTEELIARLRDARAAGRRVVACKHSIDDRYDPDHLITHTRERFDAIRAASAEAIERGAADAEVLGIDEGHFFGLPLVAVARRLAAGGRRVIVVGLEHDAWGRPFDPMPQLAELALHVVSKRCPCTVCGAAAMFTQRMVPVTDRCMVGGVGDYEPRCRAHFEPLPPPP